MTKWTLKGLYQSSIKLSSSRLKPPESPTKKLEKIVPFAGVNTVLFQLSMRGVTQKYVNHRINILFIGLDVSREPKDGYIKVEDNTGVYYFNKPSLSNTISRNRCSCHDYFFTWGIWNFNNGALFGDKPRPYRRLTPPPPKGYPYRNPNKICGICKHVYNAMKYLQATGYVIN